MNIKTPVVVTLLGLGLVVVALIVEKSKENSTNPSAEITPTPQKTSTPPPQAGLPPTRPDSPKPPQPPRADKQESAPRIHFDQESIDYGEVLQGTEVTKTFTLRNQGEGTLRILDVNTTCECAVLLPEKRELPPGDSLEMKVTFKTGSVTGPQHKTISVRSNDPNNIVVILHMHARVNPVFVFDPPELNFGELERGAETYREVSLHETQGKAFAVEAINASAPYLKVDTLPDGDTRGAARRFKVTIRPNGNPGAFLANVSLKIDRPNFKPTLVVQGTLAGQAIVLPQSLFFGMARHNQAFSPQSVMVRSRNASPLEIISVNTGVPWLKATINTLESSRVYRIDFVVDPLPPPGRFEQAIQITTSDSPLPYIVTVSGVVRKKEEGATPIPSGTLPPQGKDVPARPQ